MCGNCPVQAQSACVRQKTQKLSEWTKQASMPRSSSSNMTTPMLMQPETQSQTGMPRAEEIPGAYCSTGMAGCKDLNIQKSCICGSCAIYAEYRLSGGKPVEHFCFNGSA